MKRLFITLIIGMSFLAVKAQTGYATQLPVLTSDSVINTGTTSKIITVTSGLSGLALQINLSLVSGTGAGTVALYGSLDNVNYTSIGSAYTITNVATQSSIFYVNAPVPVYIKVLITGSGTEKLVPTVWYLQRLYQRPY
jgi:hypothetical protein